MLSSLIEKLTPKTALLIVFAISVASILGAWGFEHIGGYLPCALCLLQRIPYYVGVPVFGLALIWAYFGNMPPLVLRLVLIAAALTMLVSAGLGAYHAGVEWKFWPGPQSCTGTGAMVTGLPDLSKPVVLCDQVQLRILGLSFAGWNALVSLFCVFIALMGLRASKAT